jgi:hypothetical protein
VVYLPPDGIIVAISKVLKKEFPKNLPKNFAEKKKLSLSCMHRRTRLS